MSKELAIVILNWNGKNHLANFLPSIVKYSSENRIILADNNSGDDSIEFVKTNFPTVEIVVNDKNGGFAKGYNDALKKVDAKYYCLLNSDVEVTENWTKAPLEALQSNPELAVCQPKIKSYQKKEYFEYAGAAGGYIDKLGYPFCRGRIFNELEKDIGQYNQNRPIFWATGACMFIKSEIFHQLNGFDASYFAHMEEIDLCWRLKNKGYQIEYIANSTVYHLGGGTLSNLNPQKTFLNFRNSLLTLYKNEYKSKVYRKIFFRLVLDGVAAIKFIFEGNWKHALSILKAHNSFYKLVGKIPHKGQTTYKTHDNIYKGLIISEYYLKKNKKFTSLKKWF